MIERVLLSPSEKKLIIKLVGVQLRSLAEILDNNLGSEHKDLTLFCIENELPQDKFIELINQEIELFRALIEAPQKILSLPNESLSIIKTILANIKLGPEYKEAELSVWRKFFLHDRIKNNQYITNQN